MARSEQYFDILTKVVCFVFLIAKGCSLPATDILEAKQAKSNKTELFAYPAEQSTIESKQNARNRTPIYIPEQCAENEILYPGDHENDWVCDCKPTYVYHPIEKRCYQLHTKGFCSTGQIIYIEPNGRNPVCIPNQCPDGEVLFLNVCSKLNQQHQNCTHAGIKMVVGINEATHELECVNISDVKFNHTLLNPRN